MTIEEHFPDRARKFISVTGKQISDTLGKSVLRDIAVDVLCGLNIRNATERLTKRRVGLLNAALLVLYSSLHSDGYDSKMILRKAHDRLREDRLQRATKGIRDKNRQIDKVDKTILRWILGLTKKQVQNVLRSDDDAWVRYTNELTKGIHHLAEESSEMFGIVPLSIDDKTLSWEWAISLMMATGSQTLATRGAEKSLYGKFFEKVILVCCLTTLGFEYTTEDAVSERCFWLSSHSGKRESDATAIWNLGQGVRFDIGFIGKGNPEITLDKVSRFERQAEFDNLPFDMKTFVIVDTVAQGSSIFERAKEIDGTIIQMSSNYWVQTLGNQLCEVLDDYTSPLAGMDSPEYRNAIREGVDRSPIHVVV